MKTVINIAAVFVGCIIGSFVNGGILGLMPHLIPLPPGSDMSTMEGVAKAIEHFELKHFLSPFLAHAIGTLVGAIIAGLIAFEARKRITIIVGVLFFIAGAINVFMLPAPLWYDLVDLAFAYFPMSFMGLKVVEMIRKK